MRLLPRALVLSARSLGRPQALPGTARGCITQHRGQGPGEVFTNAPWLEMVCCERISILIYTMDHCAYLDLLEEGKEEREARQVHTSPLHLVLNYMRSRLLCLPH